MPIECWSTIFQSNKQHLCKSNKNRRKAMMFCWFPSLPDQFSSILRILLVVMVVMIAPAKARCWVTIGAVAVSAVATIRVIVASTASFRSLSQYNLMSILFFCLQSYDPGNEHPMIPTSGISIRKGQTICLLILSRWPTAKCTIEITSRPCNIEDKLWEYE